MSKSDLPDSTAAVPYRPAEILTGVAQEAWQAYNAMQSTKQRHYELLEAIDLRKRNYNINVGAEDTALLAHLLADHDQAVRHFTAACVVLKKTSLSAHSALFDYIGMINNSVAEHRLTH
ncbi:MAG: hypothetical protein V3U76_01830 [Granulosicoccus sp.]